MATIPYEGCAILLGQLCIAVEGCDGVQFGCSDGGITQGTG